MVLRKKGSQYFKVLNQPCIIASNNTLDEIYSDPKRAVNLSALKSRLLEITLFNPIDLDNIEFQAFFEEAQPEEKEKEKEKEEIAEVVELELPVKDSKEPLSPVSTPPTATFSWDPPSPPSKFLLKSIPVSPSTQDFEKLKQKLLQKTYESQYVFIDSEDDEEEKEKTINF